MVANLHDFRYEGVHTSELALWRQVYLQL